MQVLSRTEQGKESVIEIASGILNRETSEMCKLRNGSFLRLDTQAQGLLEPSTYSQTLKEMQKQCPHSFKILSALVGRQKMRCDFKEIPKLITVWSILLFNRNRMMNRLQTIYSLLLYKSRANTKVRIS